MKQNASLKLLTGAYLNTKQAPRSLRYILSLSYLGITIGALALMLTLLIMRGFERDTSIKMKSINSDAVIASPGNQLDPDSLSEHIKKVMGRFIKGISGHVTRHIMIERNDRHHVLFLRGINPADEQCTTSLADKVTVPKKHSLTHLLSTPKGIVIGATLAANYRLCPGDEMTVYIPEASHGRSIGLEKQTVTITGIFSIGLDEFDSNAAYCSLKTMQTFYPDLKGVDQLAVSFTPRPAPATGLSWWQAARAWYTHLTESTSTYFARQLHKLKLLLSSLSVRGWQELYPDLVATLALEKYVMTTILGLISLVSSMLMICLLFMFLQYKQHDIAILRALGASQHDIYRLFRRLGMTIVLRASLTGLTLAALIGWWLDTYKMIRLPDAYYISHLPAALEPINFVVVFVVTFLLGWLACRIPLRQLNDISVAQTLRGS